jgi:hypothetical protein
MVLQPIARQEMVVENIDYNGGILTKNRSEPLFAHRYHFVRIGEGIDLPVKKDTFQKSSRILLNLTAFHMVGDEIPDGNFRVVPREIEMRQVIHRLASFTVQYMKKGVFAMANTPDIF